MSNFMFSLDATLPVFLVIVLGWFLMQIIHGARRYYLR